MISTSRCSHCRSTVTRDDAACPRCGRPPRRLDPAAVRSVMARTGGRLRRPALKRSR
ncbi:hypothetical protein DVA67_029195 [Solirubrobacter sp. CPCC 204708]|nr:hypothetical protein [Solirubrobacter deserti]